MNAAAAVAQSELRYPFPDYPAPGTVTEVAPGLLWISSPVPFVGLRQVNLWLLEDGPGWTLIDCGYGWAETQDMLDRVWSSVLGGRPVTRIIGTHFHPDHAGNMAWIAKRWGDLMPVMTMGEWFAANLAATNRYSDNMTQRSVFYAAHGIDDARRRQFDKEVVPYHEGVSLPPSYRRVRDRDLITIGNDRWQVITGQGHSPEHLSLHCAARKILIAGDQILPGITTNVSTWPMEPEADTLKVFLDTCAIYLGVLDPQTLVLPSHRKPFYGVHERLRELDQHHQARLALIQDAATSEVSAGDLLDVLFPRSLDGHQLGFAMGEAIAHLNHLVELGRLQMTRTPTGGYRYKRISSEPVRRHFT